jgi:hypothetical protein
MRFWPDWIPNSPGALRWALWPRFMRWCHLMSQWAHLDPHRAVTITRPIFLTTISIECDCGRVFWKNPRFHKPPSYDGYSI